MDFKELLGSFPNTLKPGAITVSEIMLTSNAVTPEDYLILAVSAKVYSVLHPTVRVNFDYRGCKKYTENGRIYDWVSETPDEVVKQDLERKG